VPWSNKLDLKARREKRQARKAFQGEERKRKADDDNDDLDELANDARLLKKLKRGHITQAQFDDQTASHL
jgi:ATP-dependent RNA helicase DDX55/SPB4